MKINFTLGMFAHGRSGDKGNHANIAVIAYTKAGYDWLQSFLTADVVARSTSRRCNHRASNASKRRMSWA